MGVMEGEGILGGDTAGVRYDTGEGMLLQEWKRYWWMILGKKEYWREDTRVQMILEG